MPFSRRRPLRPLSPVTYLVRNPGKTVPLTAVILLAVLLIAGVVAIMDSIPYSIRTIYGYSRLLLFAGPRGESSLTDDIVRRFRDQREVPVERIAVVRAAPTIVRSIVGKWPFAIIGFSQDDLRYALRRMGSTGLQGRLPAPGAAEAVVSEPVARNRGLRIGSVLMSPDDTDNFSPFPVKVVGIAQSREWFMFSDIDYIRGNHFPPIDVVLVFAPTPADQERLGAWARREFRGERVQVLGFYEVERDAKEMFKILYAILNVVIAILVSVIALMVAMLMNIHQAQRLVEFGLLQALGHTRRRLLLRSLTEASVLVLLGWVLGVALSLGLLAVFKRVLLDPQAFAMQLWNPQAVAYTVSVPAVVLAVAWATVIWRFRRFDPVGIVERRLV
ncbi:MAG: ABC transporter permease [Fimbriimonadales bacterium]|nr:ABC transporter permease [Fimbriimonadales bacterium]